MGLDKISRREWKSTYVRECALNQILYIKSRVIKLYLINSAEKISYQFLNKILEIFYENTNSLWSQELSIKYKTEKYWKIMIIFLNVEVIKI